jgi:hypothetical protein
MICCIAVVPKNGKPWCGSEMFAERERVRPVWLQGFDGCRQDSCLPRPEKRRRQAGITRDPDGPIRDTFGLLPCPLRLFRFAAGLAVPPYLVRQAAKAPSVASRKGR